MVQTAFFLLTSGCIGTRNVEPEWEYPEEEELVVEACGSDDTGIQEGFTIAGSIKDLVTLEPPENPEALCAYALDPTPVLSGGEPEEMAGAQVCDNGDYEVSGITNPPGIGMFISIADCEGNEPSVMKSATGVDYDDVKDLGDGDTLEDQTAYLVTLTLGESIDANLTEFEGNSVETGFMAGFLLDASENPVQGGTVACGGCVDFYYMDADPSDGLFMTAGERNASTDAEAGAIFVAPAAPIFTYAASDGGAHTWDSQLFGSLPGYASFLLFNSID